jgi:mRNA interferase MazF
MIKINPDTNNNLEKESSIDCFQIRSVSEERFIKKIGFAKKSILEQVVKAIEIVVQQDF